MAVAVLLGLATITLLSEAIEFVLVQSVSGQSGDELQANQPAYFAIRNNSWIIYAKPVYTMFAAAAAGYLAARIAGSAPFDLKAGQIIAGLQIAALVWAGYFSNMSATAPAWLWGVLLPVVPIGILAGLLLKRKVAS